jgi:ABC-type arginine transport system ATPase subunit
MSKPKLLMMDEPSLGLAPLIVRGIFDIIKEIKDQGVTILLIEQNANLALRPPTSAMSSKPAHQNVRIGPGTSGKRGNQGGLSGKQSK